jgi:hypothetical protein
MADKTQNITVNYKFNTADVERAQQPLNRVNQLNNQIQQSASKVGQQASSGYRQATQSILSMQVQLARLKTQIEVSTNPATTARLSAEYRRLKSELDAATKSAFNLANAQKQTAQNTSSLASQFGNLYGAVRAIVTAGLVRETVNTALAMARLSGNVEGVERAFKRAFPNSVALLNRLRTATRGAITDFELMQRTLQATNLGVSVERLPELLEFAAIRSQQTGVSMDYLVQSIVDGIGRKSIRILDNLGISATRLRDHFKGVALESLTVAQVTEGVAAVIKEETDKMGGYVETAATKVDQLTVAWNRLYTQIAKGSEGVTAGVTSFLTQTVEGFRKLITSNKELFLEQARNIASADALRIVNSKEYKEFGDNQQKKFDFIQQEINSRVQLIGRYNDNITALKAERAELQNTNPYDKKIDNLTRQIRGYNDNKVVIASTILALKEYLKALSETNVAEEKSIVSIKTLKDQLAELNKQREEQTFIGNTAELDRLKREILLLEDRILKIDDNIKWQQKWDLSNEASRIAEINLAQETEMLNNILDGLAERYGKLSTDAPEFKDSLEELEAAVKETADAIKLTTGEEFLIRLRLGIKGEGGETSEIQKFVNQQLRNLGDTIYEGTLANLHSIVDAEIQSYQDRLEAAENFYAGQISLAGDNERAKEQIRIKEKRETEKLRNEMARKEKQARKTHILLDIAAGIAKALATYVWPYSLIPAAAVAAQGAFQLAIVNRQPTNFAKGSPIGIKGPGTETSDSIPANLSRGETVMSAIETRRASDVLKDIRAKKLDNQKLRELKQGRAPITSPAFNDERIIKAIKEQKHPDIVKASNIVYESKQYTEEYKRRVRSSSMGI